MGKNYMKNNTLSNSVIHDIGKKSAAIWQVLMYQTIHILFFKDSTGSVILYSLMIQSNFVLYLTIYIHLSFCQLVLTRMKNKLGLSWAKLGIS